MGNVKLIKNGSEIHIKKSHEGRFTEYCGGNVTDERILKAKQSNNPTIRKLAVFAENARKWKHAQGGSLNGSPVKPSAGPKYAKKKLPSEKDKEIIKRNQKLYPGITSTLAAGLEPIKMKGHKYYVNSNGKMIRLNSLGGLLHIVKAETGTVLTAEAFALLQAEQQVQEAEFMKQLEEKKKQPNGILKFDQKMQGVFEKGLGLYNLANSAFGLATNGMDLAQTGKSAFNAVSGAVGYIKAKGEERKAINEQKAIEKRLLEFNAREAIKEKQLSANAKKEELLKNVNVKGINRGSTTINNTPTENFEASMEAAKNKEEAALMKSLNASEKFLGGLNLLTAGVKNALSPQEPSTEEGIGTTPAEVTVLGDEKKVNVTDQEGNIQESALAEDDVRNSKFYKASWDVAAMSDEDRANRRKELEEAKGSAQGLDLDAIDLGLSGLDQIDKYNQELKTNGFITTGSEEMGNLRLFKSLQELYDFRKLAMGIKPTDVNSGQLSLLNPNGNPALVTSLANGGIMTFKFGGVHKPFAKRNSPTDDCGAVDPKTLKVIKRLRSYHRYLK